MHDNFGCRARLRTFNPRGRGSPNKVVTVTIHVIHFGLGLRGLKHGLIAFHCMGSMIVVVRAVDDATIVSVNARVTLVLGVVDAFPHEFLVVRHLLATVVTAPVEQLLREDYGRLTCAEVSGERICKED